MYVFNKIHFIKKTLTGLIVLFCLFIDNIGLITLYQSKSGSYLHVGEVRNDSNLFIKTYVFKYFI